YIYCLIISSPPRSSLFPYTTLFRSSQQVEKRLLGSVVHIVAFVSRGCNKLGYTSTNGKSQPQSIFGIGITSKTLRIGELYKGGIDRKSTRLNSSHQIISYAVFCLKK